jgi:hypothetical protein
MDRRRRSPARRAGKRDVSGALRPQFGGSGVFPRSILAQLGRFSNVNPERRYCGTGRFLSRRRGCDWLNYRGEKLPLKHYRKTMYYAACLIVPLIQHGFAFPSS